MAGRLRGRTAIVIGAGSIGPGWSNGKAAATLFAREGASVYCVDVNGAAARETAEIIAAEGGTAEAGQADAARSAEVKAVVNDCLARFGRIDVLHNNVGIVAPGGVVELAEEDWDRVLAVNLKSCYLAMKHVIPHMAAGGGGSIVNVSSIAARHGGGPGSVIYAAAKGFVATATRGWAKELVRDRIRVNAVSPGVIMTPFHERYSTAEQLAAMQTTIPMDRLGTPDECVGAFLYLASDAMSGYVTGQIIEVNGGQYMP
jgi:3-oxoacyl-[acyl-carrier protein] reductase